MTRNDKILLSDARRPIKNRNPTKPIWCVSSRKKLIIRKSHLNGNVFLAKKNNLGPSENQKKFTFISNIKNV